MTLSSYWRSFPAVYFSFKNSIPSIELRGVPATLVWHSGGNLLSERNLLQVNEKKQKNQGQIKNALPAPQALNKLKKE